MKKQKKSQTKKSSATQKDDQVVIGIGASAGGLEALQDFFKAMPADTNLAFVVIQHLSPDYKSLMDELLARHTSIPISIIKDNITIEPNHIYLIPPRKSLSIFHNKLFLEDFNQKKGLNLPIDTFFRSLASDKENKAIGVILSGTGSDGTLGTRAIKEAGGMVMVQDETTAKFDGMPRSSIATGLVDFILPTHKMPEALLNYIQHPFIKKSKASENILEKDLDSLTKITLILRDYSGIDFSYYKEKTVLRRLERRISINRFNSLDQYLIFLSESDGEKDILFRELLIGVTSFFRDPEAYKSLEENVLPNLDYNKQSGIRVWSAGCSTGEEVYSIAMLLLEYMNKNNIECDLKIFATDIDKHSLEVAGQGFYPESIVADIDPALLAKYFTRKENGYLIDQAVREVVVFATHNLLKDPPFSKLNLLVCRNLFIYLKPDMQQKILHMFYYALNSNGFLFMGGSESIGEMSDAVSLIDNKWKIYKCREGFKPPIDKDMPLPRTQLPEKESQQLYIRNNTAHLPKIDKLLDSAITKFLPPSIITDEQDNIIHIINDVSRFVKLQPGKLSFNLLNLMQKDLSLFVNNLLRRLKKDGEDVIFENISDIKGFDNERINLEGKQLKLDKLNYYIISFRIDDLEKTKQKKKTTPMDMEAEVASRATELEKELQTTRENLQATVEELETSNEELQSSNEELIASNEELQSTNEELQSVNEELYTVNNEYQAKNQELTKLNNDLNNLLKNTAIGAMYLDRDLRIRKITPLVSKITNIRDKDIDRPISHIAVMENYPELMDDINSVMDNLNTIDKKINDKDGNKTWLSRIRPYRTQYNSVEGIIATFIDITDLAKTEAELKQSREFLQTVLDSSPLAKTLVDANGNITYANKTAESIFGISEDEILNRTYDASKWEITDVDGKPIPSDKLPFAVVKSERKCIRGFQHYIKRPGKKKVLLKINGCPIYNEKGEFDGVVFSIDTDSKQQYMVNC